MKRNAAIKPIQLNRQRTIWQNLLNLELILNVGLVGFGLICQDLYASLFHWSKQYINSQNLPIYLFRYGSIFIMLYCAFYIMAYFVKLPALQSLYHKKTAHIVLGVWLAMNLSCYQLLYFEYKFFSLKVYCLKFLHLLALYALTLTVVRLIQRRREFQVKQQLIFAAVFCLIGWVLLLLTYPGAWRSDDITQLNQAGSYYLNAWKHIFSGIYTILCLQTLPFVGGVIFIQIFLIALLFSYCVVTLGNLFAKTPRQTLILEIVLSLGFILPPIINFALSGYRMGIYQFLELYLLTRLIDIFYHKGKHVSWLNLLDLLFFTVLVGTWRTECFFYPLVVLIVLLFIDKNRLKRSLAFATAGITFIGVLSVNLVNTKLIGDHGYIITNTFPPVCSIIREADDLDADTLATLDKVIDIEFVKTHTEISVGYLYSHGGLVKIIPKKIIMLISIQP